MHSPVTFLVADDDAAVLTTLHITLTQNFPNAVIYTATDGGEAFSIAESCLPDLTISDLTMPVMNGIELCRNIRQIPELRNSLFYLLTGHDTSEYRNEAQLAGVDEYINKPFALDTLLGQVRAAVEKIKGGKIRAAGDESLRFEEDLDTTGQEYVALISAILSARIPQSAEILPQVATSSCWIAEHFSELDKPAIRDLEIAARIALLGKISLPDSMIHLPVITDGTFTHQLMSQVPITAQQIVSVVPSLERVARILRHIFENMDGSGFPDRLQAWQIPLSSRIIRIALDYEEIRRLTKKTGEEVIQRMQKDIKRLYDVRILTLLEQYLSLKKSEAEGESVTPTSMQELKEGMVLARDIMTSAGLKLIPAGATLTSGVVSRIISHNSSDPIIGKIYVRR